MDRSARIALSALAVCLAVAVAYYAYQHRAAEEEAYQRDDQAQLADNDTGLRKAYDFLRKGGYRVALETPETAHPPPTSEAWWIFQSSVEWFAEPEARAAEVKRFAQAGGTVVIAPAEALTARDADDDDEKPSDEDGEHTTGQKASDRFFAALGLDVHLLAFEAPADDDDDSETADAENLPDAGKPDAIAPDSDKAKAPNPGTPNTAAETDKPASDQDETYGYTLPVSGHGAHFDGLTYVQTSWGNFWSGEDLLKGEVRLESDGFPLIVEMPMGKGKIVLIAESTYFENEFLDETHNLELLQALAKAYSAHGIALLTAR